MHYGFFGSGFWMQLFVRVGSGVNFNGLKNTVCGDGE